MNTSKMNPEPSEIGSNYIAFFGRNKTEKIIKDGLSFHTINPEMSNLMLVKMFILTAILTALIAACYKLCRTIFYDKIHDFLIKHPKISVVITILLLVIMLLFLLRLLVI